MQRVRYRDTKQGIVYFEPDQAKRIADLEAALAELQAREAARDPAYRPSIDLVKRKIEPKAPGG